MYRSFITPSFRPNSRRTTREISLSRQKMSDISILIGHLSDLCRLCFPGDIIDDIGWLLDPWISIDLLYFVFWRRWGFSSTFMLSVFDSSALVSVLILFRFFLAHFCFVIKEMGETDSKISPFSLLSRRHRAMTSSLSLNLSSLSLPPLIRPCTDRYGRDEWLHHKSVLLARCQA